MRFLKFLIVLGGVFLLSAPLASRTGEESPTELKQIFAALERKIRRVQLDNGLKLILMKRGFAPVVAAYIKFRAGSFDEQPESFGIAHMLEHMLFKGTRLVGTHDFLREEKYLQLSIRFAQKLDSWRRRRQEAQKAKDNAQAEVAQKEIGKWQQRLDILNEQSRLYMIPEQDSHIYALQGARGYNAYTSSDLTNYQVQIPVHRLAVWARLESDRMQNAVLRQFYTERQVVSEERRLRVDNSPRSTLWEKFRMKMYGSHPYGHPVIGPMESIQFLDYHQAMDFYKKHYAPNNTIIALVGNIEPAAAEKIVKRHFGPLKSRDISIPPRPAAPKARSLRVEWRGGASPYLYMAWFKPPMPDPADLYLNTLSKILAGSPETRLYRRLVLEEKLAVSVYAGNGVVGNRATNLFLIGIEPAPHTSLDTIQTIALEELDKIRHKGVEIEELLLARRRERIGIINLLESNADVADLLSYFETLTGDYRNLFRYNELLDTIRSEDIQKAALRYLRPGYVMTARLIPDKD